MLMWLSFCTTHLTQEELREAVAIQPYGEIDEYCRLTSVEDMLLLGNSLIGGIADEKGHVSLAHLSVRDYLVSATLRQDPRLSYFALEAAQSHSELAADCLTYLFLEELRHGPCNSADDYMERLRKLPFLKHAANAWSYHLRSANIDDHLSKLALRLFLPESHGTFMSWIQVIHTGTDSNFKWNVYPSHATPLYYAASFGLRDIVSYLLRENLYPAELNAAGSRFGGTALHAAVIREHFGVMEDLFNAGADPSRADFNKVTPLHSAASQGSVEATRMLLRFGAATDARDSMTGTTPLEWARNSGRRDIVALIEAVDIGVSDSDSAVSSSSSPGQTTPERSTTSSSSQSSLRIPLMAKKEVTVWAPAPQYFPDHYEKRSGLDSSIILGYTVGKEVITLHSSREIGFLCNASDKQACW